MLTPVVPEVIYTRSLSLLPENYQFPIRTAKTAYEERMFRLTEHFYVMLRKGEVQWPSCKPRGKFPKCEFDLHPDDDDDTNTDVIELVE